MDKPRQPHVIRTWVTGQHRQPAHNLKPASTRNGPHGPERPQPPQKGKKP
jgi:hypothetical protein